MKLYSWNVNGIRAAQSKGFLDWLKQESPDVLCLQETKANQDQLDLFLTAPKGYQTYWHSAEKAGYSGVAIYTKKEPQDIKYGIGIAEIDAEGRVLTADFGSYVVISAYFPNSQREHERLPYKLKFCDLILKYCDEYRKKGKAVILSGDYNIAHQEIDLKNPKTNKDNAGFLPQEREWMTKFLKNGYVDTFRHLNAEARDRYTWWSYRPGVRERNIGWRLDYFCVNREFIDNVKDADIHDQIFGSDHCPVSIEINL